MLGSRWARLHGVTKALLVGACLLAVLTFYFTANDLSIPRRFYSSPPQTPEPEVVETYRASPQRIEQYFQPPDPERKDYHEWNARTLRDLIVCMALENCHPHQQKVAILAAHWFEKSIVHDYRGGEGIWVLSMYKHFRGLGYTTLIATNFEEALTQYRMFPDLVKVIISSQSGDCHSNWQCVKGPENPSGIPAWKLFDLEYFPSHGEHFHSTLLKGKWILSALPNDDRHLPLEASPFQYIGYSIEDDCNDIPFVPFDERADQAWLLMKKLTYVYDGSFVWDRSYFPLIAKEMQISVVGGWELNNFDEPENQALTKDIEDREHGVINFGKLNPTDFMRELGRSKVLIGVGNPWWSPSPFNALCQGIPFINPITHWAEDDPSNRTKWQTQHPTLSQYDPPYVYNVYAHDWDGLIAAIKQAISTPISRFIPDHMREQAVRDRLENLMETDWKAQAAILLEERKLQIEAGASDVFLFEL